MHVFLVIDLVKYLINEVKEGLKTLGAFEAIQQNPEKFREVFGKENMPKLDARMVDLLFSPNFNEEGSNQHPLQEEAVMYWRDYFTPLQYWASQLFTPITQGLVV